MEAACLSRSIPNRLLIDQALILEDVSNIALAIIRGALLKAPAVRQLIFLLGSEASQLTPKMTPTVSLGSGTTTTVASLGPFKTALERSNFCFPRSRKLGDDMLTIRDGTWKICKTEKWGVLYRRSLVTGKNLKNVHYSHAHCYMLPLKKLWTACSYIHSGVLLMNRKLSNGSNGSGDSERGKKEGK